MNLKFLVRLITPFQILVNYVRESLDITHKNLASTMSASLSFILLLSLSYFSMMFVVFQLVYERESQNLLLGLLSLPIVSFFASGYIRYYLRLVRKLPVKLKILFVGHKRYLQIFILFLSYYILYVLLFNPIFYLKDYDKIMQIRIIAGIVVFFWLTIRLIYSPFFEIDADYSARKAMKASFLLTSGRTFKTMSLLGASFVFFIIVLSINIAISVVLHELYILKDLSVFLIGIPIFFLGIGYSLSIIMASFVIGYDISLKNKYSRRKKLISRAAVIVKQKLEETAFFHHVEPDHKIEE